MTRYMKGASSSHSLQRHLSSVLTGVILIAGSIAAVFSFFFAFGEAQEFQDDGLRQVAALSIGNASQIAALDASHHAVIDPESRIEIIRLPDDDRPAWLPSALSPGFHTLTVPGHGEQMRVFVRDLSETRQLVVAQSTDTRNEIARDSALRTGIPTLILLPLLIFSITWVIRTQLQPLRTLANTLDKQQPQDFTPLPDTGVPDEILPFIAAINRLLERVEHMVRQQRRFIADAAHELRASERAAWHAAHTVHAIHAVPRMGAVRPISEGIRTVRVKPLRVVDFRICLGEFPCRLVGDAESGRVDQIPIPHHQIERAAVGEVGEILHVTFEAQAFAGIGLSGFGEAFLASGS